MGTIANKLTYLNTTKEGIKTALNQFGANIDSEPFRSYVSKISNLYTNWPKVEGEDTTLSLSPTKKGLMKLDLKGNTQQNGTPTPDTPIPVQVVSGDNTIKVSNIQLELGSTATTYEPYQSTSYPVNLGNIELCKIDTNEDYIYKNNGKWYLHKEIGKRLFDGTESWRKRSDASTVTTTCFRLNETGVKTPTPIYSDKFICLNNKNDVEHFRYTSSSSGYTFQLHINKSRLASDNNTGGRNWIAQNNITVYYVLDEPTTQEITNTTLIEQLDALETANSYTDNTYIFSTNSQENAPFIISASALKKKVSQ